MLANKTVSVRGISADKGEKVRGFVEIGETAAGPIGFPVVVARGVGSGPILCITGGVHATEYAPINAAMRLIQYLDAQRLSGTVIVVPVVSMPMFYTRTPFVSPIDGLNLNKIAPGAKDGTASETLAHVLLEEVIGVANYHIDLHGGDFGEILYPFAGYAMTGHAAQDRQGEALARLFSPTMISLARDGGTIPPFPGSLNHAASRRGVVSILAEAGGNATLEEKDVALHLGGILNILRHLKMIDGRVETGGTRLHATDRFVMRAHRSGLVHVNVDIGQEVAVGQVVAEVSNVFGDTVEEIKAPKGGIAGLIWAHKVVNTGDPVVRCWVTEVAAPFEFG